MFKYAPNKGELASRDVVSRAEWTEIIEGRGVDGCVLPRPAPPRPREDPRTPAADSRARARRDRQGRDRHADPDSARHALHDGRHRDRQVRRDARPRRVRRRRVRLRQRPRREPPRRQLAARDDRLRRTAPRRTRSKYIKSVGNVRPSERTLKAERDRIDGMLARTERRAPSAAAQGDEQGDERQRLHLPRRGRTRARPSRS